MDARQFLRGVDNPLEPYTLPHLGLVPSYQRRLDAIYPGEDSRQRAYDVTRADFERLLGLGRVDMLKGFIASRLSGTMYEDINELAFALGRSVDELQYYLNVDPLELLRQAEAQQEAVRLAQIAANAERERLRQIEEQRAADARVRQWELEAQQLVAETAARDAARMAQLIAQAEAQLRDELRAQWPAGDIDAQVTIYNQLLTQPPRSHAEVESILRDVLGEGAELQTLLRYTRNAQQGISLAETAAQIAREEAEAPIRAFQAATQAELQKTLQYIAESGSVPVEEMIATGAYTQAQIDLAAQVQARQLAEQQEATRIDLASQETEQRALVVAEIADIIAPQVIAIASQSDSEKADFYNTLISQGFDDATIRDVVEVTLGEQADSDWQALQSIAESSRNIVAPELVTAPAAPSDTVTTPPVVTAPVVTPPVVTPAPATEDTVVEQYVFGDITLPQGWYQFTPAQKATWFNQNNVTPTRLRAAGVADQDIIFLRQAGYTVQDATTVAPVTPAAGNLLPLALAAAFVLFGG